VLVAIASLAGSRLMSEDEQEAHLYLSANGVWLTERVPAKYINTSEEMACL
jgi:RNA:NAD 2'-phosphotransferase (TPT1/KptA family)